ncbi:MAG: ACP phosphodiesterase [Bacteroidota bacterium]|nr:ACP phosphodiesterase [Bacteroidota bacterium]
MNFIAHLFLSGTNEKLLVGNFIADSVKGKNILDYDSEIIKGIKFHRFIDFYTDTHPEVRIARKTLVDKYRHYSGVIIDIFFDYFLINNWDLYSNTSVDIFSKNVITVLQKHSDIMPEKALMFLNYNIKNNRFNTYGEIYTIAKVLNGMARRTTFANNMSNAVEELNTNNSYFDNVFNTYFPQLIKACEVHLAESETNNNI